MIPGSGYYYYSNFSNEKTKAQKAFGLPTIVWGLEGISQRAHAPLYDLGIGNK